MEEDETEDDIGSWSSTDAGEESIDGGVEDMDPLEPDYMRTSSPRGYTLNEMLIVLAVLVILAALAWPALRKPLARHRLQAAAKQLRVELASARLEAISSGESLQFKYLPGTRIYRVEPLNADRSASGALTGSSAASVDRSLLLPDEPYSTDSDSPEAEGPQIRQQELPEDIAFESAHAECTELGEDPDEPLLDINDGLDPLDDSQWQDDELLDQADWSTPVVFYPNGRTSNAVIQLVGDHDYRIRFTLRGVTGAVFVGRLQHPPQEAGSDLSPTKPTRTAKPAPRRPVESRPSPLEDLWRGSVHGIKTNQAPAAPRAVPENEFS